MFLDTKQFPLALEICKKQVSVSKFTLKTIQDFGGIRRGITIASQAAKDLRRLDRQLWAKAEEWFSRLKEQRSRDPQATDKTLEREAARWADESLSGIGPKQSRNLWQWLGLTRYEIPIDSRVTEWIKNNLSFKLDEKRLSRLSYYETALDSVQALCEKAGVLPCELDAVAFDYDNLGRSNAPVRLITESGFVNPYGQITIRSTGEPETVHSRYQLACSFCGHSYDADHSEMYERRCPACKSSMPGLTV